MRCLVIHDPLCGKVSPRSLARDWRMQCAVIFQSGHSFGGVLLQSPWFEASVVRINGNLKLGKARSGALMSRDFRLLNAAFSSSFHCQLTSLKNLVRGVAMDT